MVRRWLAVGGAGAVPALRPAAQVPRVHGTCGRVSGTQRGAELEAALDVLMAKAESRGIVLEMDPAEAGDEPARPAVCLLSRVVHDQAHLRQHATASSAPT